MTDEYVPPARSADLSFNWRVLAIQVLFSAVVAIGVGAQVLRTHVQPDFTSFWAAQHVDLPYDFHSLTKAAGPRTSYFAYPPTFLLLVLPLRWVTMPVGYFAWLALSTSALVASLRRMWAPAVLAVPAVFMSVIGGQTSLLIGALLFAGATLRNRPLVSGAMFGLAACIKPQAVILLPLVLLFARQWRMLVGAAATGIVLCLAATMAYGLHIWFDWLGSLPGFLRANDSYWTSRYLSLPGPWKFAALGAGAAVSAYAGRRGQLELGIFIATAATMAGSLHAMDYDEAALAPFAISAALSNRWFGLPFAAAIALPPSPLAVLANAGLATWSLARKSRLRIPFRPMASKQNGNML